MKTSELTDQALDWAVAKCEGLEAIPNQPKGFFYWESPEGSVSGKWCPSTNWKQGGPIIEREKITIIGYDDQWEACIKVGHYVDNYQGDWINGPTPLIAAMRAFVASRLGDEVEIPEELQ